MTTTQIFEERSSRLMGPVDSPISTLGQAVDIQGISSNTLRDFGITMSTAAWSV